ncbi:MAG: hypothetical protein Q8M07_23160 [Prosthecobacter sp.]|nr:hypothetical protein [Prosthecobacter sp.]
MNDEESDNPLNNEGEDLPMTPEEAAEFQKMMRRSARAYARELRAAHGPRRVRSQKNQRYLRMLIHRHTESVLRGILKAMSKANELPDTRRLLCVEFLAETDLDRPLIEIICPFDDIYRNRPIRIIEVNEPKYFVEIHGGGGTAGDGGTFLLIREGDTFQV